MTEPELSPRQMFYLRAGAVFVAGVCAWRNEALIALGLCLLAVAGHC